MSDTKRVVVLQAVVTMLSLGLFTAACGGGDALTPPPTEGDLDTTTTVDTTSLDTTGTLQLSATTGGPSPDPDGYIITLDGADRGVVATNFVNTITGLA